jgi:predicted RNA polymerase sigma factor
MESPIVSVIVPMRNAEQFVGETLRSILARWLTRNEQDAEDALQEASLRAWRAFDTFQPGRDARAWFLAIVRIPAGVCTGKSRTKRCPYNWRTTLKR